MTKMIPMKTTKEINYFDTPDDRRKGLHFMAKIVGSIIEENEKKKEALKNLIPNKENDSNNRKN